MQLEADQEVFKQRVQEAITKSVLLTQPLHFSNIFNNYNMRSNFTKIQFNQDSQIMLKRCNLNGTDKNKTIKCRMSK